MKTSLKIAWRFIIKSPVQSLLMILTITIGIASQLFIISLSSSVTNLSNDIVLATNTHVFIDSIKDPYKSFNNVDLEMIKNHENTKYASLHKSFTGIVEKDDVQLLVLHINYIEPEMLNMIDTDNNLISGVAPSNDANEIIISVQYMYENNLKVNDYISILISDEKIPHLITGVYERPAYSPLSNHFGYIVKSDLSPGRSISITLHDIKEIDEYLVFLQESFPPPFRIFEYANRYQAQTLINQAQTVGMFAIQLFITIAIVLVASSIFNYFVTQKTSQLGILKTLGFTQKQVRSTLSLMTFILGFISSILGIIVSRIGLTIFQNIMRYEDGTLRIKIVTDIRLYAISIAFVYIAIWFSTFNTLRKTKKIQIVDLIKST